MSYRYTIDGADVTPRGEWSINYERNEGQIFFRRKFTGDLTFFDDDYDLIMASADCDVLEFKIYCKEVEYWEGRFKFPYDLEVDEDSCVCVGEPEVVDEYSCIMDNYETKYVVAPSLGGITPDVRSCAGALLHTLPACYLLGESGGPITGSYISYLVNVNIGCNLTVASSFMWRDDFPNGDNYAAAYGVNNYITGAGNRLEYIYLGTNSTFRVSFGGTACDIPSVHTFKQFEEMLRNRFNAYWFIDENGDFRIEHIYFFDVAFPNSDYDTDLDLTLLISNNKRSYAYRRNKYTYETDKLYDQEVFTWQHYEGTEGTVAHGADFEGEPIFYGATVGEKSDCVPGVFKEKVFASQRFWSDITWGELLVAAGTPDTIQCPGFCMLDIDTATNWVRCEATILAAGNIINMHLSTAALQDYYFQYDRIFLDGNMNDGDVILFQTAQKTQLQEMIEFPLCCDEDPDPLDRVVTEMGDGEIKSFNRKQNSIELELLY